MLKQEYKFKVSPSSLNLMQECERCFWLEKHKVWKRPSGPMSSLPSGMDKILKEHFDRFRDKGLLPPELNNKEEYKEMKLFNNLKLLKEWRNNLKGIRFEFEGNLLFGAVDNLLIKDKKIIVLDYKTRGYALKLDTPDSYQLQLDIYNLLLRKNGYETEDYGFLLFYIPKEVTETGEVIFNHELIKRKIDVKNAEIMVKKAILLLEAECPKKCCVWCDKV